MKKILSVFILISILLAGCNPATKEESTPAFETNQKVERMSESDYIEIVLASNKNFVQLDDLVVGMFDMVSKTPAMMFEQDWIDLFYEIIGLIEKNCVNIYAVEIEEAPEKYVASHKNYLKAAEYKMKIATSYRSMLEEIENGNIDKASAHIKTANEFLKTCSDYITAATQEINKIK